MPVLSCIAALAPDADNPDRYVIGSQGGMPWHFPEDLRWFRKQTLGKPVLMGRKTFASLGNTPLSRRDNLVVSRSGASAVGEPTAGEALFFADLNEARLKGMQMAERAPDRELMVMGGGEIYAQLLPLADRLYITWIGQACRGDVNFPSLNLDDWSELERREEFSRGVRLQFCRYRRR